MQIKEKNKKISGIIFDLDGTLIDSMGVWKQIDIDFLGKRGFEVPKDYLEAITPLGYEQAADYTIKRFGLNERAEDIIREWYDMAIDSYAHHVGLKDGVKEYLEYLQQKNILLSIATASDLELVIPVLKNNHIYEMFHNITTVREVKRGKGFSDIYDKAVQKMKLNKDECIVFEDIIAGVKGAKSGEYITVGVYDKLSREDQNELKSLSDIYIMDFTDQRLREIIEER